jgi:hypothetical protein
MSTTTRSIDVPNSPASSWTVDLAHDGGTYTVTLHADSDVVAYSGTDKAAALNAYDHITARKVYVDAWNRVVNA